MVRKSERNKAGTEKGTPSRKSTRTTRRRKKSTSESEPESEPPQEATTEEAPVPTQPQQVENEVPEQKEEKPRRGRPRRHVPTPPVEPPAEPEKPTRPKEDWNEDVNFWGETSKAGSAETAKMDNDNSTWKIQSSNGSGGEIQKLKICRQRLTDSAESSSSPAKEVSSPRRKRYRKRKERHLEADGAESTGSYTDSEAPMSTVIVEQQQTSSKDPPAGIPVEEDSSGRQEIHVPQEVEVIQEEVRQEADSASVDQVEMIDDRAENDEAVRAIIGDVQEVEEELVPETVETVVEDAGDIEAAVQDPETVEIFQQQDIEAVEEEVVEPQVDSSEEVTEAAGVVPEEVTCVEEGVPEQVSNVSQEGATEVSLVTEGVSEEVVHDINDEQVVEAVTSEASKEQAMETAEVPESNVEPVPDQATSETSEERESKPAKKPHKKNLKLAVSHEDAMQQIAMKLNERAARFSKEATEEAARRLPLTKPHKEPTVEEEEEEEEGEISRDPPTTKTLELKRLDDDDVEPTNKRHERLRRPVTSTPLTPSTPTGAQKEIENDASKLDVSTEILKGLVPDAVQPVSEEEVDSIFNPKEGESDARHVHSDDGESTGEIGELAEEEGELIEDDSEGKKRTAEDRQDKHSKRRSSREELKKPERRVTKESKKASRGDRKDSRSSADEPRSKKKYEKDESKKDGRRLSDKFDQSEASRTDENHKTVRKISIVPDDAKNVRRSVSPPSKKPSPVLFITNLVRPFTIAQLRELLLRTGTIAPNGFYIDKIKSKCFVKYNDEEMAVETRHALHGVKWPLTNPRTLRVEFSTEEAMEAVKKMAEEEDDAAKRQDLAAQHFDKSWLSEKDVVKPPKKPKNLVREWDMGKDVGEIVPMQESIKKGKEDEWGVKAKDKRGDKEDGLRRRHASPLLENMEPARKIKRREAEAPAKLLDDLFRKTKATPCIYWLPLTADQIAVKEEMRRQHMAEHQKRLAEMRKTESSRRDKEKSRERDRERERARDRRRK